VAIVASLKGDTGIAIGNTIGSNIANIGLVLGLAAIIAPIQVKSRTLKREYPILFLIMLIVIGLMWNGYLSRLDGIILFLLLILFIVWVIWIAKKGTPDRILAKEFEKEMPPSIPLWKSIAFLLLGLIILPIGSNILVNGAVDIAEFFNVSNTIIGLTVIAIGTSLPELSTSIMGALKNEHDIALGNILGSNIFNLLAVLPFAGVIHPSSFDPNIVLRDLPVMFIFTVLIFITGYGFKGPGHVNRYEGGFLLALYTGYIALLCFMA